MKTMKKSPTSLKTNLKELFQKYPSLTSDYKMYTQTVIQKALLAQYERNRGSRNLTKVLEFVTVFFPYLTADKDGQKVVADRISDQFNRHKYTDPSYEKWYKKLPMLFDAAKVKKTQNYLQAVFNLDDNGMPESMSVREKEDVEDTFTVIVKKDSCGTVVFALDNISKGIAMTSLSEITKAMS